MFDKELIKLMGENKKYVAYVVLLMIFGMLANIGITASICWAIYLLIEMQPALMYISCNYCDRCNHRPLYCLAPYGRSEGCVGQKSEKGLARAYLR